MNAAELKNRVGSILKQANCAYLYMILKGEDGFELRLADMKDNEETEGAVKRLFVDRITSDIVENEELQVLGVTDDERNADAVFKYDLNKHPDELDLFFGFDTKTLVSDRTKFDFEKDSLDKLYGFIAEIGNHESSIILFKKHYPIMLLRRELLLGMFKSKKRFETLPDTEILRIGGGFQMLRVDEEVFVTDRKMLDQIKNGNVFLEERLTESIKVIKALDAVEDPESLMDDGNAAITRRLCGISANSPVISRGISAERLVEYTKTTEELKVRFHYSDDGKRIRLDTKASKMAFLKLLNDAFLRSELTEHYYEANAKVKLE